MLAYLPYQKTILTILDSHSFATSSEGRQATDPAVYPVPHADLSVNRACMFLLQLSGFAYTTNELDTESYRTERSPLTGVGRLYTEAVAESTWLSDFPWKTEGKGGGAGRHEKWLCTSGPPSFEPSTWTCRYRYAPAFYIWESL